MSTASGSSPPRRKASKRLRDFIGNFTPAGELLPLMHITRAYSFDDILDGDTLEPQDCDVFGEKLIYLFYGRPAAHRECHPKDNFS
jgi:hypothetical protein